MIMAEKPPEEAHNVQVNLHVEHSADQRRYNLPTADEIAAIVPGDGSEDRKDDRDIVLHMRSGGLKRISHLHPHYASLHYAILHHAPLIPAGMNPFCWNLQESTGMAQESAGMGRNPQEWTGMALEWTKIAILELRV